MGGEPTIHYILQMTHLRRKPTFTEVAEDQVVFHEPDFQAPVTVSGLLAAGLRQRTRFTSLWCDRLSGYD